MSDRQKSGREFVLPVKLAEEVKIQEFHSASIDPTYIVTKDDRRFQISQSLYRLLTLIDGQRSLRDIAESYSKLEGKVYQEDDINAIFHKYLLGACLLRLKASNEKQAEKPKKKSFIWFRVRLFSQEQIRPLTGVLQYLFKPYIAFAIVCLTTIFMAYFLSSYKGADIQAALDSSHFIYIFFIMFGSVFLHELGHSSACHFYRAQHGEIGIGMYLFFPVFYADVTDVWKLPRKQRVMVDFAGIYFQLIFNVILYVLYQQTGVQLFRDSIFIISIQLVYNLNPFFRFDGYWIASDILGIPNLAQKSKTFLLDLLKKKKLSPFFWKLKKEYRFFAILYFALSNVFFVFVFFRLFVILPDLLIEYPDYIITSIRQMGEHLSSKNWNGTFGLFYALFFRSVLLLFLVGFMISIIRSIVRKLQILKNSRGHPWQKEGDCDGTPDRSYTRDKVGTE